MSLHADALATLRAWVPAAVGQDQLRRRMVHHLETRPDGLQRSCFPDHLTAGTLVLSADGTRVLLNLHRKARRWFAFGGHCEPGDETLAGAALREGREESGIESLTLDPVPVQLDVHVVDFCDPRGPVSHLDVRFAALADTDAAHAVSDESLDVRWWPLTALPELDPDMVALIDLARQRLLPGHSMTSSSGGGSMSAAAENPSR